MRTLDNWSDQKAILEWPVYMQRAIDLAQTVFNTSPNPRVGCVIVNNGSIVGEGWHVTPGQAHAEVMALDNAQNRADGGIAFVTLEPCSHTGRTGPCAEALIKSGIQTVVIAGLDPDPRVSGNGIKKLEDAGIEVCHLEKLENAARKINPGYFKRNEFALPYVRVKLAMSLDGRTALSNGESKWISSSESRADVQKLRLSSSAILTGINTVIEDDPGLNVRVDALQLSAQESIDNEHCLTRQPLRVILDSQLRTPGTARILNEPGTVKIFTADSNSPEFNYPENVNVYRVPGDERGVELKSVLESLASESQCNDVLVEAGSTLAGSLIESNLADELIVYIAPKLLGSNSNPLLEMTGRTSLAESWQYEIKTLEQIGRANKTILVKP